MSLEASLNVVVVQTINSARNSAARKRLHGDDGVRAALQNTRVASLLPPVGTEVFRCITAASLWELQQHQATRTTRGKREKNKEVRNMRMTCQQTITRDTASDRMLNICKNCEKKKIRFQQLGTSSRCERQHLRYGPAVREANTKLGQD